MLRTEIDLEDLESKQKTSYPGVAINQMLTKWGNEPQLTAKNIDNRAAELWKTKEQFE